MQHGRFDGDGGAGAEASGGSGSDPDRGVPVDGGNECDEPEPSEGPTEAPSPGVPVSPEEFRRRKQEAARPDEDAEESGQGEDDSG